MARVALRVLQIGAIAAVVMALPYGVFDLDRFLLPKELILHITAVVGALLAFGAIRRMNATRVDLLLALYVLLGVISALLATNRWLGLRAVAVSASGVIIFWVARALPEEQRILKGVALAVAIAAAMSLIQAYGVRTDFFALNRAPGGTLGNRNFVAHVAAIGLPVCLLLATSNAVALPGIALLSAALVLTRSRAAWLATAAMLAVFLVALLLRREWPFLKRLPLMLVAAAAGVAVALFLPNTLHWRSGNPYLESVHSVANYEEGSGRGRLVQYGHSLKMAVFHPVLGVGPGNWPAVYPRFAARNDPSMNPSEGGMTYNPWPSSDWIAFVSERGVTATVVLVLALLGIAFSVPVAVEDSGLPLSAATGQPAAAVLHRTVVLAILVAVIVEGMFDAVLLLAVPTLLVFAALGALMPREPPGKPFRVSLLLGVLVVSLAGAAYGVAELVSMQTLVSGAPRTALERASQIDPGNYKLQMRLARSGGKQRCEHALAAHELFPTSDDAARLSRGCR